MTSFARTPSSVNVKAGPKNVTFSISATDASNITSVQVSASRTVGTVTRSTYASLKLTSGTAKNGTWTGKALIPQWTNAGTWNITAVYLSDAGGGFTYYSPTGGLKPWNAAWPKTFTVVSTPDVAPPVIKSVKLSKTAVNTASAVARIGVTIKVTDNLSGLPKNYGVSASGSVVIAHKGYGAYPGTFKRTAGSARNGTYTGSITVPRWVLKGTHVWQLSVSANDQANNYVSLTSAQLKAKHFAYQFKVTSKTDATKPVLKSLTYAPHSVDARTKNKTVAFTLKATDTLSGIAIAYVRVQSPSGISSSGYLSRHSGTAFNGTFTGKAVIPRCSEPGTWTISVQIIDVAGNVRSFTPAQLKAKHFGSTLSVKALDTVGPSAKVAAKVPAAGPITVTFSEPTLWKNSAANTFTVDDYSKFPSAVAGTWTCKNAAAATVTCDSQGANVKTASFQPSAALTHADTIYISQKGSTPGIYDLTGNQMSSLYLNTTVT